MNNLFKTLFFSLIIAIGNGCTVPVKSLSDCELTVSRSSTTAVMTCKEHEPISLPNFDPAFLKCARETPAPTTPSPDSPDAGSVEN